MLCFWGLLAQGLQVHRSLPHAGMRKPTGQDQALRPCGGHSGAPWGGQAAADSSLGLQLEVQALEL